MSHRSELERELAEAKTQIGWQKKHTERTKQRYNILDRRYAALSSEVDGLRSRLYAAEQQAEALKEVVKALCNGRRYYLLDMIADSSDSEVVTYTVVYGSVGLTRAEGYAAAYGQSGFRPFDTDSFRNDTDSDLLPLFICVSCAVMATAMDFCTNKAKQRRFRSFYGKDR